MLDHQLVRDVARLTRTSHGKVAGRTCGSPSGDVLRALPVQAKLPHKTRPFTVHEWLE